MLAEFQSQVEGMMRTEVDLRRELAQLHEQLVLERAEEADRRERWDVEVNAMANRKFNNLVRAHSSRPDIRLILGPIFAERTQGRAKAGEKETGTPAARNRRQESPESICRITACRPTHSARCYEQDHAAGHL